MIKKSSELYCPRRADHYQKTQPLPEAFHVRNMRAVENLKRMSGPLRHPELGALANVPFDAEERHWDEGGLLHLYVNQTVFQRLWRRVCLWLSSPRNSN